MCTLRPVALDRDKTLSPKTPVKMHMPHGRGAKTSSLKIIEQIGGFSSVQFSSVTQSCPTLCDPMNCSTPGLPVHQTQNSCPRVYSNSCPSSQWCHPAISSSVRGLTEVNFLSFFLSFFLFFFLLKIQREETNRIIGTKDDFNWSAIGGSWFKNEQETIK